MLTKLCEPKLENKTVSWNKVYYMNAKEYVWYIYLKMLLTLVVDSNWCSHHTDNISNKKGTLRRGVERERNEQRGNSRERQKTEYTLFLDSMEYFPSHTTKAYQQLSCWHRPCFWSKTIPPRSGWKRAWHNAGANVPERVPSYQKGCPSASLPACQGEQQ